VIDRLLQRLGVVTNSVSVRAKSFSGEIHCARIVRALRKVRLRAKRCAGEHSHKSDSKGANSRNPKERRRACRPAFPLG
jgi:hypothetical protein